MIWYIASRMSTVIVTVTTVWRLTTEQVNNNSLSQLTHNTRKGAKGTWSHYYNVSMLLCPTHWSTKYRTTAPTSKLLYDENIFQEPVFRKSRKRYGKAKLENDFSWFFALSSMLIMVLLSGVWCWCCVVSASMAGLLFAKSCAVAGAVWCISCLNLADAFRKVCRVFVAHTYCVGSSSDCVRGDGCVQWCRIR